MNGGPMRDPGSGAVAAPNGGAVTDKTSSGRSSQDRTAESIVRRILGAGITTLAKFKGGVTGGTAFPAAPVVGACFFRTDKQCWYMWDGAVWQIVGVEQTGLTTFANVQTINSTTVADVTGSVVTITTTGSGAIFAQAHCRTDADTGALLLYIGVDGVNLNSMVASGNQEIPIAVGTRVAVAAGVHTLKLLAGMAGAATSAVIQWGDIEWIVSKS